jgi:1-acyl-sn-glycerol-3-phosphate acyltransferase
MILKAGYCIGKVNKLLKDAMNMLNQIERFRLKVNQMIMTLGYHITRAISIAFLKIGFQFQVIGLEHLSLASPYILAGNHTGYLDSLILVAASPKMMWFLMARSVYDWPLIGRMLRLLPNILPINQQSPRSALNSATQLLNDGESLVIFPEGKLTRDGKMNPFKRGVLRIQEQSQRPIIPFTIKGGFKAWGWGRTLPTFSPITLIVHPPIFPQNETNPSLNALEAQVAAPFSLLPSPLAS